MAIGPRFSNTILQTLLVLTKKARSRPFADCLGTSYTRVVDHCATAVLRRPTHSLPGMLEHQPGGQAEVQTMAVR